MDRICCHVGVLFSSLLLSAGLAIQAQSPTPPCEPEVSPLIPDLSEMDLDGNRIDDLLDEQMAEILLGLDTETDPAVLAELQARLIEPVAVDLVFSAQITQAQIDGFVSLGGEFWHVYEAIGYGWNGALSRVEVENLPDLMGPELVLLVGERAVQVHLDEATRAARVSPVWAAGFAGSTNGFDGDTSTTIAIMDTGVDESHTDLAGRMVFFGDFTDDPVQSAPNLARDRQQHGTHVAAIATGTGASHGAGFATLDYTDSGSLAGTAAGSVWASPIHIGGSSTISGNALWNGGGTTSLGVMEGGNGTTGWAYFNPCWPLTTGSSPLGTSCSFSTAANRHHSAALAQGTQAQITEYGVLNTVTNYPLGPGGGFNVFRGVAPGASWGGAKVFRDNGTGTTTFINTALDSIVLNRQTNGTQVLNMSLGVQCPPPPTSCVVGLDASMRTRVNNAVRNGIVVVASAGNDGPGAAAAQEVDDPGRAGLALTVGAANDVNELTAYTSSGPATPNITACAGPTSQGLCEDVKPDLLAPGGSDYQSWILSADSNDGEETFANGSIAIAERQQDDYRNMKGTSMAAPFVAGAAALVIDAYQQQGNTWSFTSGADSLAIKTLLLASATETGANREAGTGATNPASNPTLGRAATPKDRFEGYGMINPDAAIEALTQPLFGLIGGTSGGTQGGRFDRRAWGWGDYVWASYGFYFPLIVPPTADFDLYLYAANGDNRGNPVILASSTNAGNGVDEFIYWGQTWNADSGVYLFVKHVSGSGTWSFGNIEHDIPGGAGQPTVSVGLTPTTLWPPNHRMVDVTANVTTANFCSPPVIVLESVTSNEADDAHNDGSTTDDIQGADLDTADFDFELRAERATDCNGRTYTVTYRATDNCGSQFTGSAQVGVPPDLDGVVEPLTVLLSEDAGGTVLSWDAVPGASAYNVIRGDLGGIQETATEIDLGSVICVESGSPDTSTQGHADPTLPGPQQAFFYLVEYDDGTRSGYGTETAEKPRIPAAGECP